MPLLKHIDVDNKKIVSILSGGNMDVITMASIVQLGLIQRDRIFTVSILLRINQESWPKVSALLAKEQVMSSVWNITSLSVLTGIQQ